MRECELEYRDPLVNKSTLGKDGDRKSVPSKCVQESRRAAEARQQHQSATVRFQVIAQARAESLRNVVGAPGAITIILRHPLQERRIEYYEIEALPGHWREQVAKPHIDPALLMMQENIDAGATYCFGIDVDGHDTLGLPRREYGTNAGSSAQIQNFRIAR